MLDLVTMPPPYPPDSPPTRELPPKLELPPKPNPPPELALEYPGVAQTESTVSNSSMFPGGLLVLRIFYANDQIVKLTTAALLNVDGCVGASAGQSDGAITSS